MSSACREKVLTSWMYWARDGKSLDPVILGRGKLQLR
jgi:hypothetical protein